MAPPHDMTIDDWMHAVADLLHLPTLQLICAFLPFHIAQAGGQLLYLLLVVPQLVLQHGVVV